MKSFTLSQRNQRRERISPLHLRLPVAIPSDIEISLKNQMFEVLNQTPFEKLSFSIQTFRRNIDRFNVTNNDRERVSKMNMFVNVGFIKSFDLKEEMFDVFIFGSVANDISKFKKPAIEIVYTDDRDGNLKVINRFNIIDLEQVYTPTKPLFKKDQMIRVTDVKTHISNVEDALEESSEDISYTDGSLGVPLSDAAVVMK